MHSLTSREVVVLRLIADGETSGTIATALKISPATVRTHATNILKKTGTRTRAHAVAWGFHNGFIALRKPDAKYSNCMMVVDAGTH